MSCLQVFAAFRNIDYVIHVYAVDMAVELAHVGIFYNSGQTCSAGSRTFVEDKIYDEFVEKSVAKARGKKVGNPFDSSTELGPQVGKLCSSHRSVIFNLNAAMDRFEDLAYML